MLSLNQKPKTVEAVLTIDMLMEGEECSAGDVVELSQREYKYQAHLNRALPATKENVAAVRADVANRRKAAEKAAAAADELNITRNQLATALAEIERLKAGK
jgi:hypothetical protein